MLSQVLTQRWAQSEGAGSRKIQKLTFLKKKERICTACKAALKRRVGRRAGSRLEESPVRVRLAAGAELGLYTQAVQTALEGDLVTLQSETS